MNTETDLCDSPQVQTKKQLNLACVASILFIRIVFVVHVPPNATPEIIQLELTGSSVETNTTLLMITNVANEVIKSNTYFDCPIAILK